VKALPLWQPWASLVVCGAKRVETRGFPPSRLGLRDGQRLAIHATKAWGNPSDGGMNFAEFFVLCTSSPFSHVLMGAGFRSYADLPRGALIGTCVLDHASQITADSGAKLAVTNPTEYHFGDYTPGRWAWALRDVEPLPQPIPFRGSQGAFDVPDDLVGVAPVAPPQGALL
jgi:hypothetical protein